MADLTSENLDPSESLPVQSMSLNDAPPDPSLDKDQDKKADKQKCKSSLGFYFII